MKRDRRDIYSSYDEEERQRYVANDKNVRNKGGIFKLIGKIFVCLVLLFVIVLSIVTTALTVYVMKANDSESTINLDKDAIVGSEFTSVYGKVSNGEYKKLNVIDSGVKRIWVDIADVPQHVKDAVISTEDNEFYNHEGVNFKRTFAAFLNMFLKFWDKKQGGSTITQQLLKNITGENAVSGIHGISRKINEIYKAMSLEKKYSKDQILQAYLNIIYVGHGNNLGVATAAKIYFNKNLKDISIAEAACLAALIRNPGRYDMIKDPNKIVDRRNYVLNKMYNFGKITKQECESAKRSPVKVNAGSLSGGTRKQNQQSYFVDSVLNQLVLEYLAHNKDKSWEEANQAIKKKGYHIYTTIDIDMQERLEKEYEKLKFAKGIQSAFVIFDLNGNMKACVGGLGKKMAGDRSVLNYATSHKALILPGSTVKPFVYADLIEKNEITYSTLLKDAPFKKVEGKMWPENNDDKHSDKMVTVNYAVQKSLNTIPTKLLYDQGNEGITKFCDFLTNKLKISNLVSPRKPLKDGRFETCAMAMGSLTKGVVLSEFSNAFQIFANGGEFTPLTTIEKVTDKSGEEKIKFNRKKIRVISKDTAAVCNRLLRNVVLNGGTGVAANLDNISKEVVGKTGTSNDGRNLLFIGCTPKYVAGIWFGSSTSKPIPKGVVNPAKVWGNVMSKLLAKKEKEKETFSIVAAKEQTFCVQSGLLCNKSCPKKELGYYKRDNQLTKHCNIHK